MTVGDPPRRPHDAHLSTKVGTKFRQQVAVAQSIYFACVLRVTELHTTLIEILGCFHVTDRNVRSVCPCEYESILSCHISNTALTPATPGLKK
jgi:hypothetical protein